MWPAPGLIAAGVDGTASGRDAVALGALLARRLGGELLLVAVHEEPVMQGLLPREVSWSTLERQSRAMLAGVREEQFPDARIVVEPDTFVWRGLRRAVRLEHRDLLTVGSAQGSPPGRVRVGNSVRELMGHLECPLLLAPAGIRERESVALRRIGALAAPGRESDAALGLARSIGSALGAALEVRDAAHDAVPTRPGAPDSRVRVLRELREVVDLLVIGSDPTGRAGRVELGHAGNSIVDQAPCPILLVPRPAG